MSLNLARQALTKALESRMEWDPDDLALVVDTAIEVFWQAYDIDGLLTQITDLEGENEELRKIAAWIDGADTIAVQGEML